MLRFLRGYFRWLRTLPDQAVAASDRWVIENQLRDRVGALGGTMSRLDDEDGARIWHVRVPGYDASGPAVVLLSDLRPRASGPIIP